MKRKTLLSVLGLALLLGALIVVPSGAVAAQGSGPQGNAGIEAALGTAFTYQGRLDDGGSAADGTYDFEFKLHDAVSGGSQVGSTVAKGDVTVTEGLFAVELDFGTGAFTGEARWLEIGVRAGSSTGAYTTLTPRQALTPAPYALALPGLRTEPNTTSPNVIGGYSGNVVTNGVVGATISGGGIAAAASEPAVNAVTDDYGTVGGGRSNQAGDDTGTTADASYATVGGGFWNWARGSSATIGGGSINDVTGDYGTIGGGSSNDASGEAATVGGGGVNEASGYAATVGGGVDNTASNSYATVGGGYENTASGWAAAIGGGRNNESSMNYTTVGGGVDNTANGNWATVGGGVNNTASGSWAIVGGGSINEATGSHATVGGGYNNIATGDSVAVGGGEYISVTGQAATVAGGSWITVTGDYAAVGGGVNNIASSYAATIGGGEGNSSGYYATVGGGYGNTASHSYATVSGGLNNSTSSHYATVSGGLLNTAGDYATVPGGLLNTAVGWYSFAAGRRAQANHNGAFVWADDHNYDFASTANYEFSARATGGVRFVSAIDGSGNPTAGVILNAGAGSWSSLSDRNFKENFAPVDAQEVLARLAEIPVTSWNYKSQDPAIRHIGPMAQDFYAAFGMGEDDEHISTMDADGVALAAVQGLYQIVQAQDAHIETLEAENGALQGRLDSLEARVAALEGQDGASVAWPGGWSSLGFLVSGLLVGLVVVGRKGMLGRSPGGE